MFLLYGQTTKCPVPAHMFEQREFMRGTGNLNFVACPYLEEHESSYSVSCTRTLSEDCRSKLKDTNFLAEPPVKELWAFSIKNPQSKRRRK